MAGQPYLRNLPKKVTRLTFNVNMLSYKPSAEITDQTTTPNPFKSIQDLHYPGIKFYVSPKHQQTNVA